MRYFPPPLEIGETEGFSTTKDIFKRAEQGSQLTRLISLADDPMVVAVDGPWGSGKTVFLRMWAGELRKAGLPVVYFDAFENDYQSDAFIALASQIVLLTEKLEKNTASVGTQFKQNAIDVGKLILHSSLRIGVRAATAGILDSSFLDDYKDEIAQESTELMDKYVGGLLSKAHNERVTVTKFRDSLESLSRALGEVEGDNTPEVSQSNRPLVFIIDELDRCRPDFALAILERAKHFFSVRNVQFVLGVNMLQLQNSVEATYGLSIDSSTYLQKFLLWQDMRDM